MFRVMEPAVRKQLPSRESGSERLYSVAGNANSALIICGSEHIDGLTRKFVDAGYTVTSEDVTSAGWFDYRLVREASLVF